MAFNIGAGLEAAANAGQGYLQGQQQSQDNQYKNNMQKLAYDQAALDFQQKKLDTDRMQKLSDHMIQTFNPQTPGPKPPGQPGQQGQNPQDQMGAMSGGNVDPGQYTQEAFNYAAKSGDVTHAQELATNLINMRTEQANQAAKQAAMQTSDMKARQQALETTAQMFQGVTDQASYDQVRMNIMSDPGMPQSARQAIASLPSNYSPAIVDHIKTEGMKQSETLRLQIQQQNLAERIRQDNFRQQDDQVKNTLSEQREKAQEQHWANQTKVGATNKVPSSNDITFATAATKQAMGPDVDTDSDDFKNARNSIASRAQQIMKDNRAVNAEQAVQMAAQEAKNAGEIGDKTTTTGGVTLPLVGTVGAKTTTKATFQDKGSTPQQPINGDKQVKTESDLVDGKYYTFTNKQGQTHTYQAQGGKLNLVQ
jgi:hypothetical protein